MAATRKLTVEILGDAKGAMGAFGQLEKGTSKLGQDFVNFGKKVALGFAAVGAGAVAIGKTLIDAGERASTSNARIQQIAESMGVFGDSMNGVSASAEEVTKRLVAVAEATARQTGVDQNAIKETQAKLLTFKELALTAGEVGGAFDRATQAAVDMAAAGFGEASQNAVQLGKALNDPIKGITALSRSGITFTEAEKERIKTLVESNRIGEAQAMILEAIEKQVGGTAEATANASDKMKVAFSQLQERLGQKLLPVFEKLATFFITKLLPAVERFVEKGVKVLRDTFDSLRERLTPVVNALRNALAPILEKIIGWLRKNIDTVKVFFGVIAGATVIAAVVALGAAFAALFSPIVLVIGAIAAVAAGLYYAYQQSETFRNAVDAVARFFKDTVVPALVDGFNFVKDAVSAFVGFFQERMDAIKAAMTNIREFFEGVLDFIGFLWDTFGQTILGHIQRSFDAIKNVVQGAVQVLRGIFDFFLGVLSGDWGRAWDGIKNIVGGALETIKGVVKLAVSPIIAAFDLIKIGVEGALEKMRDVVISILGVIRATFSTIFGTIFNIVADVFRRIKDTVKSAFQTVVNGIISAINAVIGAINGAIRAFNLLPGPDIGQIGRISPVALAEGGIVTGPTFALIGEAGPEAVVPLSGQYMPDFLKSDGGGGGGSTTIQIQVDAGLVSSPDQVGQQIIEAIRRAERRSGQVFASV